MPRQPIDWERYRDAWVERNLAYSLKALAREHGLSYGVLARKAREGRRERSRYARPSDATLTSAHRFTPS